MRRRIVSIGFFQGQESLSVLDLSKDKHFHVKHYRIRRTNQGMYYISSKTIFANLQDLVDHYRSKQDKAKMIFLFIQFSEYRWFVLFINTTMSKD